MEPKTIGDFVKATIENLTFIHDRAERRAKGVRTPGEPLLYEVTQLLNSLALPLELVAKREYFESKAQDGSTGGKTLREQVRKLEVTFPKFSHITGEEPSNLGMWAAFLRDAAAHFNIEFEGDPIANVVMWDEEEKTKRVKYKGRITPTALKEFAEEFLKAVQKDKVLSAIRL